MQSLSLHLTPAHRVVPTHLVVAQLSGRVVLLQKLEKFRHVGVVGVCQDRGGDGGARVGGRTSRWKGTCKSERERERASRTYTLATSSLAQTSPFPTSYRRYWWCRPARWPVFFPGEPPEWQPPPLLFQRARDQRRQDHQHRYLSHYQRAESACSWSLRSLTRRLQTCSPWLILEGREGYVEEWMWSLSRPVSLTLCL